MDNLVEQRSQAQAFFDKYILPQYLAVNFKDEVEKIRKRVIAQVTKEVTERLEAKRIKEQEQIMLRLYIQMNLTVKQIAVVFEQEEEYVIKALKKHNVYKLDK